MPCTKPGHNHQWVTEGNLEIQRCEDLCGFCGKQQKKGWFLRRHVKDIHCGRTHLNLNVLKGWEGKPDGNARPHSEQSAENRRKNKLAIRAHSNTAEAQQAANTVDLTHFGNDEAFTNLIAAINPDYKTINATATYDTAVGSFEMLDLAEPTTPEQQVNVNTAATPDHLNIGTVTTPESMDPSQLGACGYVNNISPWTVQQTARLTIDPGVGPVQGERRFLPLDTGADYIRTNLNKIFTEVRAGSVITDAQILGTAQSYLKAFAQGELASPATPTCGAFFVTGDNVPAATSNAGEFSFA